MRQSQVRQLHHEVSRRQDRAPRPPRLPAVVTCPCLRHHHVVGRDVTGIRVAGGQKGQRLEDVFHDADQGRGAEPLLRLPVLQHVRQQAALPDVLRDVEWEGQELVAEHLQQVSALGPQGLLRVQVAGVSPRSLRDPLARLLTLLVAARVLVQTLVQLGGASSQAAGFGDVHEPVRRPPIHRAREGPPRAPVLQQRRVVRVTVGLVAAGRMVVSLKSDQVQVVLDVALGKLGHCLLVGPEQQVERLPDVGGAVEDQALHFRKKTTLERSVSSLDDVHDEISDELDVFVALFANLKFV